MGSVEPAEINLRLGWPNAALLPVAELKDACQVALSRAENFTRDSLLEYGPDDGYLPLRVKIAKWLTDFYQPQTPISTESICLSGGASQNLSCALQAFTDPAITKYIWMVAPTYFCACRVFDDAGFAGRLRAVPEDQEGLDIDFLAKALQGDAESLQADAVPTKTPRSWNKTYRHVMYAVPTFANPSGKIMSLTRREALLRLARKHDALVITDDVYDMLQWSDYRSSADIPSTKSCQPRVVDIDAYLDGGPIDEFGHSLSQGSFSKIMGPGLRTGWAQATPSFAWGLSQCGATRSGGCGSQFTAAVLSQIMETSLPQYIHTVLIPTYARRYHKMMAAITELLVPLGVSVAPPDKTGAVGGYYLWLQLPRSVTAQEVARVAAEEYKLLVHPGSLFLVEHDTSDCQETFLNGLRVCFVWEQEDLLLQGVERLAHLLEVMAGTAKDQQTSEQ